MGLLKAVRIRTQANRLVLTDERTSAKPGQSRSEDTGA